MIFIEYNLQFFAKDGPGGEKTEPATSKKLEDIRKEGQVAKSKELIMSVSLFAMFLIIKIYVGKVGEKLIEAFSNFYNTFSLVADSSSQGYPMSLAVDSVGEVFMEIVEHNSSYFFSCNSCRNTFKCNSAEMDGDS